MGARAAHIEKGELTIDDCLIDLASDWGMGGGGGWVLRLD